jgi:hypothetical protein
MAVSQSCVGGLCIQKEPKLELLTAHDVPPASYHGAKEDNRV